jgi:hypothetical protein
MASSVISGSIKRGIRNARPPGLLHFVRNDGNLNPRHRNKASAASEARQRRSRRGNPGVPVIARRRSRRGNPDGLIKMHFGPAGLLHTVRNDGKGVMNYGSINCDLMSDVI